MRARFFHFVLRERTKGTARDFFFFFSLCLAANGKLQEIEFLGKLRRWSLLPVPGTQPGDNTYLGQWRGYRGALSSLNIQAFLN
ncbi:hypothetical protein CKAH01_01207 [Colletotrichum kahawae]|uniref:Uncharacterized protein n=1 Tax=Colletotrichum kahawae TaxID=34407 RepID=A0AAD9YCF7_COLKA|nr:hypothetical protein CKAH01_01207 [Colletotrichum kahawae]